MTRVPRATALLTATAALALGAVAGIGCGDDEESPEVTVPTISVEETVSVPTETSQPETGETGSEEGTGGTGTDFDPSQEDSETNDKPPEPGSPEAAFEEACKQNPAACG